MNFDFQQPAIFTAGENLEGKGTGGLVLNQAYRSHVFPEARTNPVFLLEAVQQQNPFMKTAIKQ